MEDDNESNDEEISKSPMEDDNESNDEEISKSPMEDDNESNDEEISKSPMEDDNESNDKEISKSPMEDDNESNDEEADNVKPINNYKKGERCGKSYGSCEKGYCCSQYGWCGKSDRHCELENGCQSKFGYCKPGFTKISTIATTTKIKTNSIKDRCGKGYGSRQKGYCCSQYGWCGKSDAYCNVEKGCQSGFGKCSSLSNNEKNATVTTTIRKVSSNQWRCGKTFGSCKEGYCCSRYGWCGKDSHYCGKGCQSEFGKCW